MENVGERGGSEAAEGVTGNGALVDTGERPSNMAGHLVCDVRLSRVR